MRCRNAAMVRNQLPRTEASLPDRWRQATREKSSLVFSFAFLSNENPTAATRTQDKEVVLQATQQKKKAAMLYEAE